MSMSGDTERVATDRRTQMEEKIYRNTRNGNKFLEVVRYACGHYHVAQFMQWGEIRNYTGGRMGRRRRTRWTKTDLKVLLNDYTEVAA